MDSQFIHNQGGDGGAIYVASGLLNVSRTMFSLNGAYNGGGAIESNGTAFVNQSSFISNTAPGSDLASFGGAIVNDATMTVVNSTFVGNVAVDGILVDAGGAIGNIGTLTIINSTFFGNQSANGGALSAFGGIMELRNTIVSNSAGGNCSNAGGDSTGGGGLIVDGGHNLEDSNTCGFGSYAFTRSLTDTNPLLGSLGYYGGLVVTIPLLPGSPAINAGNDATCPPTDERGVARPFGPHCDIGAYEAAFTVRRYYMPLMAKGGPGVVISTVMFHGTPALNMSDRYIELENRGASPVNVSGWVITALSSGKSVELPGGTVLQPRETCHVYGNSALLIGGPCNGLSFQSPTPVWSLTHDTALLRDSAFKLVDTYSYTVASPFIDKPPDQCQDFIKPAAQGSANLMTTCHREA